MKQSTVLTAIIISISAVLCVAMLCGTYFYSLQQPIYLDFDLGEASIPLKAHYDGTLERVGVGSGVEVSGLASGTDYFDKLQWTSKPLKFNQ